MVYEIWSKRSNGSWEMVESGCGTSGKDRLAMYQKRHPRGEFRLVDVASCYEKNKRGSVVLC